jgi:hypothetical protein
MDIMIVLAGASVLAILAGGVTWVRQPSRREVLAIYLLTGELRRAAEHCLSDMAEMRTGRVPRYLAVATDSIDACIDRHLRSARTKVPQLINEDFYVKAAKAALPRKKWKVELQEEIRRIDCQMVDQTALLRELTAICTHYQTAVQADLASVTLRLDDVEQKLPVDARDAIVKLLRNDRRLLRFLGNHSDLARLVNLNLGRDVSVSVLSLGTGAATLVAVSRLDAAAVHALLESALQELLGSELAGHIAHELMEWMVQEFGEGVLLEIGEAVGAALTGIGIFFTAWKAYRYYSLYQRLFVEKEPLQRMRASAECSLANALHGAGERVEDELKKQTATSLTDLERQIRAIHRAAVERQAWALARLGGAYAEMHPGLS